MLIFGLTLNMYINALLPYKITHLIIYYVNIFYYYLHSISGDMDIYMAINWMRCMPRQSSSLR